MKVLLTSSRTYDLPMNSSDANSGKRERNPSAPIAPSLQIYQLPIFNSDGINIIYTFLPDLDLITMTSNCALKP